MKLFDLFKRKQSKENEKNVKIITPKDKIENGLVYTDINTQVIDTRIKKCIYCGKQFMAKTYKSRFCSHSCQSKYYYYKNPNKKNKKAAERYKERYNNDPEYRQQQIKRISEYHAKKYKEDPEFKQKVKDYVSQYNKEHREERNAYQRKLYQLHKDDKSNSKEVIDNKEVKRCLQCGGINRRKISDFCCPNCYQKYYYQLHKEILQPKHRAYSRKYREEHPNILSEEEKVKKELAKQHYNEAMKSIRLEKRRASCRKYYYKNRDRINKRHAERYRERVATDPEFRARILKTGITKQLPPNNDIIKSTAKQTAVIMNSNTYNYITENNLFGLSLEVFLESGIYLLVRPDLDGRVLKDNEIIVR